MARSLPGSINGVSGETIGLWGKGFAVLEPTDGAKFMFVTGGSVTTVPTGIHIRVAKA